MVNYQVSDKAKAEILKQLSDNIDFFNKEIDESNNCIAYANVELEITAEPGHITSWEIKRSVKGVDTN